MWAPSVDDIGKHNVTLRANDDRGANATLGFEIVVAPADDNHAPIIFSQPSQSLPADQFSIMP